MKGLTRHPVKKSLLDVTVHSIMESFNTAKPSDDALLNDLAVAWHGCSGVRVLVIHGAAVGF